MLKIAVINGSLRKDSYNKKLANEIIHLAPNDITFEVIEIAKLPIYNQDFDDNSPMEYTEFREKIKSFDAVLFFTPEHNRTYPAALKNAIDIGSRPYGKNIWSGKPAAIISSSPGSIAGFGANSQLRLLCTFVNLQIMAHPEAFISNVHTLLDENGKINNEDTKKFFQNFINAFVKWIEKNK